MSFRRWLTLFFVLIVIVPMMAVTIPVFVLIADNEHAKADARVAEAQRGAAGIYREFTDRAAEGVRRVTADGPLVVAIRTGDVATARSRARALLGTIRLRRIAVQRAGHTFIDVGTASAVAPAGAVFSAGPSGARLEASAITASDYGALVEKVTGQQVVLRSDGRALFSTLGTRTLPRLPRVGTLEVAGRHFRVATFDARSFGEHPLQVSVLSRAKKTSSAISRGRLLAGAVLAGFLLLAFVFALAVSRALQAQISRLLNAAQRLGRGDFSTAVPTQGDDEFAALGEEFNKMSRELEERLEELGRERSRLEGSIRRIGQTFASNLDREALLEIVVRTTVDALGADCSRASVREPDGRLRERVMAGQADGVSGALEKVEAAALDSRQPEEAPTGDSDALAFPLTASDDEGQVLGLIAIARSGRPFSTGERDLFHYLAAQAAVSLENVGLHELVQLQAVTDELTGLFNHRRFQEVISREVERSRRFGQELGLIMLDIDDFKQVNDTYGHQQGDLVLREVAQVLRANSREVDEPARYGGEELAVALPQTDLDGAYNLAERMRSSVEELAIPRLNGSGELRITASFGVAAIPDSASDKNSLIAAADAALYEAKRGGKNRTERPRAKAPKTVPAE